MELMKLRAAIVVWDRLLSVMWNCSEEHVRAVRRHLSGDPGEQYAPNCSADCRCPRRYLKKNFNGSN